jgi:xylan 1,4-beta-xylosidase
MRINNIIYVKSIIICLSICMYPNVKALAQNEITVEIKTGTETGRIRALNGGTLSPVCNLKLLDLSEEFKELQIPLIRLHDAPWFNDNVVDIHTIFRDFRLDPADENNYDFRKTDDYIKSILKTGTGIVFRLGESIEHTEVNYFVNPPADFNKWAEICCGIIRHYNNGWANGFHHNIKLWEVWNEPDERPKMWTGTEKLFMDFFAVAAKRIKAEFPDVLVGGPAFSHPFLFQNGKYEPANMATNFLSYCREESIPLDFFSWHSYGSNPWETVYRATLVRDLLDKYGFKKTENHMNEWNYIPDEKWNLLMDKEYQGHLRSKIYAEQYGCKGASFVANVLMLLQDAPVDVANYYTTTAGLFGIFSEYGEPHKSYYAFKAFAELLKTPVRVETNYNKSDSVVVCSGVNSERSRLTILASNFSSHCKKINFKLPDNYMENLIKIEVYIIDEFHDLEKINEYSINSKLLKFSENLPSPSVLLLVCKKN